MHWTHHDRELPPLVEGLTIAGLSTDKLFEPGHGLSFMSHPEYMGDNYFLSIQSGPRNRNRVLILATDLRGRRNALHTLRQLLRQYGLKMPLMEISDAPAFPTRGLMLDVSRDKVPTLSQLKQSIDLLASLKFNHLQLYTEHTFAYRGHEEVWADASPLTPEEIRELDLYCTARGIELAANQNCFGHLAVFLKRSKYNHLAEIEGDGVWKFMQWDRRGPFSLCPTNPDAEAFVRDLLAQLLPNFTSPLVNIGCDETFDVGWGRSKPAARAAGPSFSNTDSTGRQPVPLEKARASLFFEFVNKVCTIVRAHNKRPMLWADIAMSHPEMLSLLPKDAIGLAWGYEPGAKFADECRHLREHGLESWVCPGTSSWRSFTGRTSESRANIAAAARDGLANGATGFLICDWGDVGHMQQWPITLARLADAAEAAWRGELSSDSAATAIRDRAASLHIFSDHANTLVPWLNELGDIDLSLRQFAKVHNAAAIFNDLFPPVPPAPGTRAINAPLDEWLRVKERFDDCLLLRPFLGDQLIDDEATQIIRCTRLCIDHGASCRRSPDGLRPREADFAHLKSLAEECLADHRRLWLIRNRPGGLEQSCSHLRRVIASLT